MLSISSATARSLPYGHFVNRTLRFFKVPLDEPTSGLTKPIGSEIAYSLGFAWKDRTWVKAKRERFTLLTSSNDRLLNNVYFPEELLDFSLPLRA